MSSARRANKLLAVVVAFLVALSTMTLGGCAGATGTKDTELDPQVSSPTIGTDGVLTVGVNASKPPYAGVFEGNTVGIDVDIAAILAEELGLAVKIVNISGQSADTALSNGTVDVVMEVEKTSGSVSQGTLIGPYLQSGPALFTVVKSTSDVPTIDLKSLAGTKVATQKESLSAWSVDELIGSGTADPREALDEALGAVESGEVTYAAADAIVGSYLAVDLEDVSCVKMLGTPIGVYMAVAADNTTLAEKLTETLRSLRDGGQLKTILSKWLGPVSAGVVMGDTAIDSQTNDTSSTDNATNEVDTGDDLPDPSNAG